MHAKQILRCLAGTALASMIVMDASAQVLTVSSAICREIEQEAREHIARMRAAAEVCANSERASGLCRVDHQWCAKKVEELFSGTARRIDGIGEWEARIRYPTMNLLKAYIASVPSKAFDKNSRLGSVIALWGAADWR